MLGNAEQNGGDVRIESTPGAGTQVRILLPVAQGARASLAPAPENVMTGTETLLLVEDDTQVRHTARRVLESLQYRVLEAASGVEALEILAASDELGPIDLMVTDVVMPAMNGAELAREIRTRGYTVPVLFVSGQDDDLLSTHGVIRSEVHFLPKPYTAADLSRSVRAVLAEATRPAPRRSNITRAGADAAETCSEIPLRAHAARGSGAAKG